MIGGVRVNEDITRGTNVIAVVPETLPAVAVTVKGPPAVGLLASTPENLLMAPAFASAVQSETSLGRDRIHPVVEGCADEIGTVVLQTFVIDSPKSFTTIDVKIWFVPVLKT